MSVWVLTTPGGMKYRLCLKQWYIIPIFTTGKTGTLILTFTSETSSESQSQELNLGILTSKHITLRVLLLTALKMQNKWLKGFHQTVLHLILFFRASPHTRFSAWTWPKTNPFSLSPFKIPFKQQYLYEVGPGSKKPSLSLSLPFSPTLSNGSLQFLVGILSRIDLSSSTDPTLCLAPPSETWTLLRPQRSPRKRTLLLAESVLWILFSLLLGSDASFLQTRYI